MRDGGRTIFLREAVLLLHLLALAALSSTAGCAAQQKTAPAKRTRAPSDSEVRTRAPEVQQAVMVFVDRFIPALAEACEKIERNARTPEIRVATQARKIGGALAAMKNAVNPNPYAGLLDTVVMVSLLSDAAESPATRQLYGDDARPLAAVLAAQKADAWELASRFVSEAQLQELRQSIKEWQEANPDLQYVSFVRITALPDAKQIPKNGSVRRPNSVFGLLFLDPFSNLDPAVREVELSRQFAERAFFYLQRMPLVIGWQTGAIYTQMLAAPEVQATVASATTLAGSSTRFTEASDRFAAISERVVATSAQFAATSDRFAATSDRFAATVERFRADLPQFRNDSFDKAEQAVARQRDTAIRQAATQVTAERDAAVRQLASSLRAEQRDLAANFREIVERGADRLFSRAVALVGIAFAAMVLFQILFRNSRKIAAPRGGEASTATSAAPQLHRLNWSGDDGGSGGS